MKLLYLFLFPLIACNNNYEAKTEIGMDSLKKYSYYISGFNGYSHTKGTGFFVKHNEKTFFITSKYLIAPFDTLCNREEGPNYWSIFLPDTLTKGKFKSIHIDIKEIQDTIRCPVKPDIISIQIEDPINYTYYSIDLDSIASPISQTPDSISVHGYPYLNHSNTRPFLLQPAAHIDGLCGIENEIIDKMDCKLMSEKIDMRDSLMDYSGAPVFKKDHVKGKWLFFGCWLSASPYKNTVTIIKSSAIYTRIQNNSR
jgi:hypothetical protein